jgi:hypothetical protein
MKDQKRFQKIKERVREEGQKTDAETRNNPERARKPKQKTSARQLGRVLLLKKVLQWLVANVGVLTPILSKVVARVFGL